MQVMSEHLGAVLLVIAAVGWYISVMLATMAMTATDGSAGTRARAAWVCVLPVVLLAIAAGKFEIAVGMIFASSVACMTLVLGVVTLAAGRVPSSPARKAWGMLLPVSLICMLIGLSSGFDWKDALILLVQGVAILWMWESGATTPPNRSASPITPYRLLVVAGAVIVATLAGAAALLASTSLSPRLGLLNAGLVTALMLAPSLTLPLIGLGLQAAHDRKYDEFVGGLVGFVLLNLCLLLPIATFLWITQPPQPVAVFDPYPATAPSTTPATEPATHSTTDPAPALVHHDRLPYPMAVWRVDTVLLIAVGLLLLPVSMGRWSLGPAEAIGLILTWAVFMILTVIVSLTHRL